MLISMRHLVCAKLAPKLGTVTEAALAAHKFIPQASRDRPGGLLDGEELFEFMDVLESQQAEADKQAENEAPKQEPVQDGVWVAVDDTVYNVTGENPPPHR